MTVRQRVFDLLAKHPDTHLATDKIVAELNASYASVSDALGIPRTSGQGLSDALRRAGYDGVELDYSPLGYNHREIMVLDPKQAVKASESSA